MKLLQTDLCAGCGLHKEPLAMLEFTNGKGIVQHLDSDCVMGIVAALELPTRVLDGYAAAYVGTVLGTNVSVVNDDAGT